MDKASSRFEPTPAQTVGPYFGMALTPEGSARLMDEDHSNAMFLSGTLTDGAGNPVKEGMVEVWQADADGRYRDTGPDGGHRFTGFGACHAGDDGSYQFITVKPGPVPAPDGGMQAPHINVTVNGLGILRPMRTRIYFSDEEEANANDPVLQTVVDDRRRLLVAQVEGNRATFDIRLQGDDETPFFAL